MRIINQGMGHRRYGVGTVFALKGKKVYVASGKLYGGMASPYPGVLKENTKLAGPDMMGELLENIG